MSDINYSFIHISIKYISNSNQTDINHNILLLLSVYIVAFSSTDYIDVKIIRKIFSLLSHSANVIAGTSPIRI
jgi:hypothetical protein